MPPSSASAVTAEPIVSFSDSNLKLVEAFDLYLLAENYAETTRQKYTQAVRTFADHLRSADVRTADLQTLRLFLYEHGQTPSVFQSHRLSLRAFYRWLTLAGVITYSPVNLIARPKGLHRPLPRCLTEQEIEKLIAAARRLRELALIELLYATGLRASEAANLMIRHLDLESGVVRVINGKGGKDRRCFAGEQAVRALRAYIGKRKHGAVFVDWRWHQLNTGQIATIVRSTAKRAGLDGVHAHTLRHTFATVLMNHGADIRHVQELMGHERVSTTAIYLHTAASDLSRVIERCHPHGGTNV